MNRNNRVSHLLPQELRYWIEKDYADFLEEIDSLTLQECFKRSEKITIYKNLYRAFCRGKDWKEDEIRQLCQYRHPLQAVCGWYQYEWCDWDERLRHILWNICDKEGREAPAPESEES